MIKWKPVVVDDGGQCSKLSVTEVVTYCHLSPPLNVIIADFGRTI